MQYCLTPSLSRFHRFRCTNAKDQKLLLHLCARLIEIHYNSKVQVPILQHCFGVRSTTGVDQRKNIIHFHDGPKLPVIRDMGHLRIRWDYSTECLFTEEEATKLQYRFGTPGFRRIHEFLKRTRPSEVDKSTRAMLEKIHERCKECQHLTPNPYVVKVAIPLADAIIAM